MRCPPTLRRRTSIAIPARRPHAPGRFVRRTAPARFAAAVIVASLVPASLGCGAVLGGPGSDAGTPPPPRDGASSTPPDAGSRADSGAPLPGSDAGTAPQPDGGGPASGGPLPSGDHGIAARYPRDVGIARDPAVIFADDFESYASAAGLEANWNAGVYHNVRIATEAANVFAGRQALEFTVPRQSGEVSNTAARHVSPELDVLFLRYYSRYDPSFDVLGSSHNGGGMSAHYYVDGNATPGVPANGTNKYLISYEAWRGELADPNPGSLNVYIYQPEQRSQWGDHFFPDGTVLPNTSIPGNFGPTFVARPNVVPQLGRWYCFEVMLRANTPGLRDGEVALWLDGALIADFPNLRLRDIPTLTIDRFSIDLHIHDNVSVDTRKWYDNVVAATQYIGPMYGR